VKTRMVTIVLAAVLGLLGVVAVLAYVHQANQRAVNGLKAVTVLFAKSPIPADTTLNKAQKEGLLSTEKVPASSLSSSAVQSVTAANMHMAVRATVAQGWVVLYNMLAPASTVSHQGGGSLPVPPHMLAVAVNMCIDEAVGTWATPGSYVAVFDTVVAQGQVSRSCDAQHQVLNFQQIRNPGAASTLLVLPKLEVLAIGANPAVQSSPGGSTGSVTVNNDPSSSSSDAEVLVTLAVSQPEAQRLILIEEEGLPYLALLGSSASTQTAPPVPLFPQQP
jgi:pilus assembly protein CpaB